MVTKHTEYLMALIGGLITLIVGIIATIYGAIFVSVFQTMGIYMGIWGMACGILIILGAYMFKSEKGSDRVGLLLMLIFGIGGVITLQGWIIGPALAIVAAALAFAKK